MRIGCARATIPAAPWTQKTTWEVPVVEVNRLGEHIGAEILGVDVKTMDEATFDTIYATWLEASIVVVRDQRLEIENFLDYSRRFGRLDLHPSKITRHPELTVMGINKFDAQGKLDMDVYARGGANWHTDGAYDDEPFNLEPAVGATRQGWSKGIGRSEETMKLR